MLLKDTYYKSKLVCSITVLVMTIILTSCRFLTSSETKENKDKVEQISAKSTDTTLPTATTEIKELKISNIKLINESGNNLKERFNVPEGFERVAIEELSFQQFLRTIKLKPHGSNVLYFDGREKNKSNVYEAVVDIPIGNRDLHQCADAVMLLRAQYFYDRKEYKNIHFNFVNGFKAEYSKWMEGYRISVKGDNVSWVKNNSPSNSQEEFRRFMDVVFAYASTLSLEKELKPINKSEMKIGDVFIKGGSPGHAIIVMDMAENKSTGEKLFVLAQSYMPAQDTQILCNPKSKELSPWYSLNYIGDLYTPEWTFSENMLKRFVE
jgi:hypothetical protein